MAPGRGYFELELSLKTLETCHNLQPGQVTQLQGTAGKQGTPLNNKFKLKIERKVESVRFQLACNALSPALQKVTDKWVCFVGDEKEIPGTKSSNRTRSRRKKDPCVKEVAEDGVKKEADYLENNLTSSKSCTESLNNTQIKLEGNSQDNVMCDDINIMSHVKADLNYNDGDDDVKNDALHSESEDYCISPTCEQFDEASQIFSDNMSEIQQKTNLSTAPQGRVQCRFCAKSFPTNPNRPMMALQQHETKFCKRNPWSQTSLEPKPVVSERYPESCRYCPKAFRDKTSSKRHEVNCSRNPEYMKQFDMDSLMICGICNHMCSNELGLAYHRTKTHGCPSSAKPRKRRKPTPCPCRFCGLVLSSHSTRFFHEHFKCLSNPSMSQGVRCRFCSQMCTEDKLEAHVLKHHSEPECHVCEICGKVYNGKHKLYQHRMLHKEIQVPSHKCPYCDKIYMLKARLKIHLAKHTEERNVQCDICGKCFKNKHQENKHRILVHENRYRYRCNKCGHGMAKKLYLENHKCGRVRRKQITKTELQNRDDDEVVREKPILEKTILEKTLLENPACPILETRGILAMPEIPGTAGTNGIISEAQQISVLPNCQFYSQGQEVPQYLVQQVQRYEQPEQVLAEQAISLQYFTS